MAVGSSFEPLTCNESERTVVVSMERTRAHTSARTPQAHQVFTDNPTAAVYLPLDGLDLLHPRGNRLEGHVELLEPKRL